MGGSSAVMLLNCTGGFLGPKMALAYRLDAISQGPKSVDFQGPTPPLLVLIMDAACLHQKHYAQARI
jgi:hypothetical protein